MSMFNLVITNYAFVLMIVFITSIVCLSEKLGKIHALFSNSAYNFWCSEDLCKLGKNIEIHRRKFYTFFLDKI